MSDRRVPNAWALALVVVAMIVTGYDFYDRNHHADDSASWDATTPLEVVYGSQRPLKTRP
jgi:hypothetical protein